MTTLLVVVSEIAALAESETVAGSVSVSTMSGWLVATPRVVAVEAHILRIVDLVCVLALSYLFQLRLFSHELRCFSFCLLFVVSDGL